MYLLMQTDGNLVLYTNGEKVDGCSTNSSGKQMGGPWINAVYEFVSTGFKENIGKLGFVDQNDTLYEYPSNNAQFTQSYTKFDKYDAYGADLPSAAYGSANVDSCKNMCNKREDCYGFAFDNQNNVKIVEIILNTLTEDCDLKISEISSVVNHTNALGSTALIMASTNGYLSIVQLLLLL